MDVTRRDFVRGAGVIGAGLLLNGGLEAHGQGTGAASTSANSKITVGLVGAGIQGGVLAECLRKMPNVRLVAICDIWPYRLRYLSRRMRAYKQKVNSYSDFGEMLSKEKELDTLVVATPDCFHAEHANLAMKAGKHVYCEKEMSHDLKLAKSMVDTANATGRLLQIGHQRRSNPVYQYAYKMVHEDKLCGRLTGLYGQWNRMPEPLLGWRAGQEIPQDVLTKYGYKNMSEFRNWRWFKKYSGGPIADLGSHQIDIFSWFLNAEPEHVSAFGGADFFDDREWYEDVTVMYDYKTMFDGKAGSARSYYQVMNTSGWQEYYERFSGELGSINLSENASNCYYIPRQGTVTPDWMNGIERVSLGGGLQGIPLLPAFRNRGEEFKKVIDEYEVKQGHHMHLENFFLAVSKNDKRLLNCPGEIGYDTAVTVLSVIPAVERGGMKIER